ncbi:hypothetical protein [Salinimicrobium soli]|uniref:hypothetical protein n=1 Tax=Salinimicrobium soli TaxID=1254399 RepID=UPI003AAAE3FE
MKEKQLPYHQKTGFKVPENYFQDFEARMMQKVTAENTETKLTNNPFKVPENYFEEFESRLMNKVQEEPRQVKVVSLFSRKHLSFVSGIAAVLAILFYTTVLNSPSDSGYEDIDMVALENYLLETLELENPEETPMINGREFSFASSANSNLDNEAVLQYLQENIDEPSILLNEE